VTAASEPDILAGVERAAKAFGIFAPHRHDHAHPLTGWLVERDGAITRVLHGEYRIVQQVTPALALAFCLLLGSDAGPVDVGRCPACEARGGPMEWTLLYTLRECEWRRPLGWVIGRTVWVGGILLWAASRLCPACNATGREPLPVARLLLDAASGDETARDRMLVHADQLQASGDPLGELLGLALGPWAAEPTDCGECPTCKGRRLVPGDPPSWANPYGEPPEDCGCGDGRVVGHPHTAAALRWLEWLTWAREFDAGYVAALTAGIVASRGEFEALARAAHRGWVEGTAMPAHLLAGR
jgi:hypothetical protein